MTNRPIRQRAQPAARGAVASGRGAAYPTAADVARAAGVSEATVSLVLNDKAAGRVSAATQARVRTAVRELGYRVDLAARGLATGRRHSIALVIPDLADPFFAQVAMGVAESLGGDYQLLLVVASNRLPVAGVKDLVSLRVDGLLVDSTSVRLLNHAEPRYPVVVLDAPGSEAGDSVVEFDITAGASALGDHLIELGHRHIGYLDWNGDSPTFEVRRRALAERVARVGRHRRRLYLAHSAIEIDDAARVFSKTWSTWQSEGVTAVVCATDLQAYGVLRAGSSLGLSVPSRLSVAGFNDLTFSSVVNPPLTSVQLPAFELGRTSADLLRRLVQRDPGGSRRVVIPTRLIQRQSTGEAPVGLRAHAPARPRQDQFERDHE